MGKPFLFLAYALCNYFDMFPCKHPTQIGENYIHNPDNDHLSLKCCILSNQRIHSVT
jgi:hypothetical protein